MSKYTFILIITISIISCASIQGTDQSANINKLESENHLLKKKVILLDRNNLILEEENSQQRKNNKDKDARIVNLLSEIKSLSTKYANEIALWQQKYDNLQQKHQILEKDTGKKISDLTILNKEQEFKFSNEIKKLNSEAILREQNHAKEIEKLKNEASKNEFLLSKKIEEVKLESIKKDEKIIKLEANINELNAKLKEINLKENEKSNQIKELEKSILDFKNKLEELNKAIVEKENTINSLKQKSDQLEKINK